MTERMALVALLIGALILVAASSDAETDRWVDEGGNVCARRHAHARRESARGESA